LALANATFKRYAPASTSTIFPRPSTPPQSRHRNPRARGRVAPRTAAVARPGALQLATHLGP
jgi:hypothetical protein